MQQFSVEREDHTFVIYDDKDIYGTISFDHNNIDATMQSGNTYLKAARGDGKDMVLKEGNRTLFTFKFDYLWGGAELIADGRDTGLDIKGRWFRPGTRLVDDKDNDLIVAVKKGDGLEVKVLDTDVTAIMVLATVYYHIYASGGKMLSLLTSNVIG